MARYLAETHPELASQLVDADLAGRLTAGSGKKVQWRCSSDPRHVWAAVVYTRVTRGTDCAICAGRRVMAGVNDLATTHPEIAAQLVDADKGSTVSARSTKKLQWRCSSDPRHKWGADVASRVKGGGCAVCRGMQVMVGVNDLNTTHPKIAAQLANPGDALSITAGSSRKLRWKCPRGHTWTAHPKNRVAGRGCPTCSNRKVVAGYNDILTTHPELAYQMVDQELTKAVAAGSTKVVRWRCDADPRHEWQAQLFDRLHGNGCPICSGHRVQAGANDLATTHPKLAAQLVDPEQGKQFSKGSVEKLDWRCSEDHVWSAAVYNRVAGNQCSVCVNQSLLGGVNDLSYTHPAIAAQLVDPSLGSTVTAGSKRKLWWQCQRHAHHTWEAACYRLTSSTPTGCPKCFGPEPSGAETSLAEAVMQLIEPHEIRTSVRGALGGKFEMDIFVPTLNLGVEFNGLYWHSVEANKTTTYHADKTAAALERGIQLVHIWEDDWRDRSEIVIRALAHRMGAEHKLASVLPDADPRIAEKLSVSALSLDTATPSESGTFLREHHIQGATPLNRSFALRDNTGAIRALLGLRSSRKSPGDWEIGRYATLGSVPEGFTRLLAHAEQTLGHEGVQLSRWVAVSPNDVSDGALYESMGFTAEAKVAPDCSYAGNRTQWTRVPKEHLTKHRFRRDPALQWEESWTVEQAVQENTLFRVFDAGSTRWVKGALQVGRCPKSRILAGSSPVGLAVEPPPEPKEQVTEPIFSHTGLFS